MMTKLKTPKSPMMTVINKLQTMKLLQKKILLMTLHKKRRRVKVLEIKLKVSWTQLLTGSVVMMTSARPNTSSVCKLVISRINKKMVLKKMMMILPPMQVLCNSDKMIQLMMMIKVVQLRS